LKVKYASPEPDQQHFTPVLISLKLKTAGVKAINQLINRFYSGLISLRLKRDLPEHLQEAFSSVYK